MHRFKYRGHMLTFNISVYSSAQREFSLWLQFVTLETNATAKDTLEDIRTWNIILHVCHQSINQFFHYLGKSNTSNFTDCVQLTGIQKAAETDRTNQRITEYMSSHVYQLKAMNFCGNCTPGSHIILSPKTLAEEQTMKNKNGRKPFLIGYMFDKKTIKCR